MAEPQFLSPTPVKHPGFSLLAKGLAGVNGVLSAEDKMVPGKKANALLSGLASLVGLPEAQALMEKLAYGERLTTGKGQTLKPAENVVEGAMALSPLVSGMARGAAKVAGKIPLQRDSSPNAIVWHGSTHAFDKFDSSKIGTGEGAQAYGHGLYLADNPAVAGAYTKAEQPVLLSGKALDEMDPAHIAAAGLHMHRGNREAVIADLQSSLATPHLFPEAMVPVYAEAISLLRKGAAFPEVKGAQGNLYKADLPDERIARMLDWDSPLSQQAPAVQRALSQHPAILDYLAKAENTRQALNAQHPARLAKIPSAGVPYGLDRMKGEMALSALEQQIGDRAKTAQFLREVGIPGVRYLDGGSRAAKTGTSNFVVFPGEESAVTILERNGVPLLKGLAGK